MSGGRPDARARRERLQPAALDGHAVRLLEGGAEYFPSLCEAIASARMQVLLETYIFEDDASGRQVAGALAAAARRGIDVCLTVDGFGTPALHGEVASLLEASGVRVAIFRPERRRFMFSRRRLRRLHRKIAVIDARIAFVGGINVLDDRHDPNHGVLEAPRLDFAARIEGPLVADVHRAAQQLASELALLSGERITSPDLSAPEGRAAGRVRATLVLRDNVRFRRAIERQYLAAIGAARREILIASAYFFPGARLRRALVHAARRGVRVRLLLQGRVEYALAHYAAQAFYDELLAAGCEIVEYRASFLHAKVAVIDEIATVGSSNIDPFSLLLAREANVFVFDRDFAAQLRERLVRAIDAGGEPVLPSRHAHRSWLVRAANAAAFGLLRFALALSGEGADY